MIKPILPPQASWNLSFSGAGHLLSYHLGVARILHGSYKSATINSVAGSSSGAIIAAVLTCFPHRLEEYTDRFLRDGGRAYAIFHDMLDDTPISDQAQMTNLPTLHIATTSCSSGSPKLFTFEPDDVHTERDKLLLAVRASCRLPVSFHPWDIFATQHPTYPEEDGIEIAGKFYVDGGIAAPCPQLQNSMTNIVISPISGSSSAIWNIRPVDNSWKIPLVGDLTARCGTFTVRPSAENLRALILTVGTATPHALKDWHQRGIRDANMFLRKWSKEHNMYAES